MRGWDLPLALEDQAGKGIHCQALANEKRTSNPGKLKRALILDHALRAQKGPGLTGRSRVVISGWFPPGP